ncbi:hypothetical protein BLNAU_5719 [Blattamonas nauphoetae]|uniref:Uncharacterized protein n=1 Tax=Blattamonas nauphoetae TaxID=2049346 RepID=A0ABQ9Y6L9_9EUKA|nr:hypothetical protein BLNAU_5719 [Blattamonas nauphoetae]
MSESNPEPSTLQATELPIELRGSENKLNVTHNVETALPRDTVEKYASSRFSGGKWIKFKSTSVWIKFQRGLVFIDVGFGLDPYSDPEPDHIDNVHIDNDVVPIGFTSLSLMNKTVLRTERLSTRFLAVNRLETIPPI